MNRKTPVPRINFKERTQCLTLGLLLVIPGCGSGSKVAGHTISPPAAAETTSTADKLPEQRPPSSDPLAQKAPEPKAPLPHASEGPVLDDSLHAVRYRAQRAVLGRNSPPGPQALHYSLPDREEISSGPPSAASMGSWVPMESEAALKSFYLSLQELQDKKRKRVRILAYGASHTQADLYTDYLRNYLQARFGDGGQGFVHLGKVNRWYKTADTEVHDNKLKRLHAQSIRQMKDGSLGLLGADLHGEKVGAFGEVEFRTSSSNTEFELAYLKTPGGGRLSLKVDKAEIARLKTASPETTPGFFSFKAEAGERVIRAEVAGGGPVHLLGLTAENTRAGIVVDTLGINGSRMSNQLKWHEQHWAEAIARRNPDLVIYAFGTNETMDLHQKVSVYEAQIREVIARLKRAAPNASCLLFAPFDFPRKEKKLWKTRSRLIEILEIQARVSQEEGCAFWDAYTFMGGPGSMDRWARAHPPLASSDHIHLKPLGYVRAAIAFTDALMRAFDAMELSKAPEYPATNGSPLGRGD